MNRCISALADYAIRAGLTEPEDRVWAINRILDVMRLDSFDPSPRPSLARPLHELLVELTDDAIPRGIVNDSLSARDLFDTELMGALTPVPHEVRRRFRELYAQDPVKATNWYYEFSRSTNYIRSDRVAKDLKWVYESEYGPLSITINLSKPEKDPKDIAAARLAPQSDYPKCKLCKENEGYAGRVGYPARQNHRVIPLVLNGSSWYLQYSPYVYYNEHCIVFAGEHTPLKIDRATFRRLLDFVILFPHYFIGSNADLPIVGGSILSHDHFQGGRCSFAMEKAPIGMPLCFDGYEDVKAGIIKWPMSAVRLRCGDTDRLVDLADIILKSWRGYTDKAAVIYAETDGEPHNTITPIARRRNGVYELDLVLRNNLTTPEHPYGLYHPHARLHHIKKENIGLIEVMGLAVLPSRLKTELALMKDALLSGADLRSNEALKKHADWAEELKAKYVFTPENTEDILRKEVGVVFAKVLEDAGVYSRNEAGRAAFLRFIHYVNQYIKGIK